MINADGTAGFLAGCFSLRASSTLLFKGSTPPLPFCARIPSAAFTFPSIINLKTVRGLLILLRLSLWFAFPVGARWYELQSPVS